MKILCDVCGQEKASVLCTADEAVLCQSCDNQVHNANKLAGKHLRFSLIYPRVREILLCDICQETRALLFCQEDRALLCRTCDISTHNVREHTKKHNKFPLTDVKISAAVAASYQASTSSSGSQSETETDSFSGETETLPSFNDLLDPSSHYGLHKNCGEMSRMTNDEGGSIFRSF